MAIAVMDGGAFQKWALFLTPVSFFVKTHYFLYDGGAVLSERQELGDGVGKLFR